MTQPVALAVLISGSGTNLQALIQAQHAQRLSGEIKVVISNVPGVAGLQRCCEAGIAHHVVNHQDFACREDFERALIATLMPYEVEWVALAGFMRRLTGVFLAAYPNRIINIHPSLLPKYPGLDTHARVLAAAELEHGCSIHFVIDQLDAGPIVARSTLAVMPGDTPDTLKARVQSLEYELYWRVLALLCGGQVGLKDGCVYMNGQPLGEQGLMLPFDQ